MQQGQKWNRPRRSFAVGDFILLVDESASRNSWPLGHITDTFKDAKEFARKVRVKTQSNIFESPSKLCLLLIMF